MRILFIEDSKRLQRSVALGLRQSGYAVDVSGDGEEGLWFARSNDYDVIILDIMLPNMDGFTILEKLRSEGKDTCVLILSAKDALDDKIKGLRTGADDYLTKPFAFDELLARLQALARRKYNNPTSKIIINNLEIDTQKRKAYISGSEISLMPREYALLEYLALRRGKLVTRTEIENHIYDDKVDPVSNVVDSAICSLRKKIDPDGKNPIIKTRRGMGYIIE